MKKIRWSDHDRHFGPVTWCTGDWRKTGLMLASAADPSASDNPATLRVHLGTFTAIAPAPGWMIRPRKVKVWPKSWTAGGISRPGRDWYWDIHQREFGAYVSDGELHVHWGAQTHDSRTDRSRCFFFPWRRWRVIRKTLYDETGERFADLPRWPGSYEERQRIQDQCPKVRFAFADFDGERIVATTKIEEWERKLGEGRWEWLGWFRRARVTRSLDIAFSAEVGKRKGSWKGGTVGHAITMLPGELHEAAFRRYCAKECLEFIGEDAQ